MIDDFEKSLIRAGVRTAIEALHDSLHSEDDHGYDLYKWLQAKEAEIVELACDKVAVARALLVD